MPPISKMNITLRVSHVNFKDKELPLEVRVFSSEEVQEFARQGAITKRNRQYRVVVHYRQFTIECPVLQMGDGNYQVIWPSFKLPYRPYPVFVYLYAAAWYLSSGDSQRAAAEKVMHFFGLETFSHTTVGRFLRRLYQILPYLLKYGAQVMSTWDVTASRVIPRKHWDKSRCSAAEQLIRLIDPVLRSPPEFGSWFAYVYWVDTQHFIV
jgi:hypothetical protein